MPHASNGGSAAGALEVRGLRKSYGGVPVLKGVDLTVKAGEVHALIGPNGAGKSTLLGCLTGAVIPDAGVVSVRGTEYASFDPTAAFAIGTVMIYQHFQLIPSLSVADNVFLGDEQRSRRGTIDFREQQRQTTALLADLGVELDPAAEVGRLSVGEQQLVEIARALRHEPALLILDEPTAALSDTEATALGKLVRRLAAERDLAVIYVTHLLREVFAVADAITIIRDGRIAWTRPVGDVSLPDLVAAVATDPHAQQQPAAPTLAPGEHARPAAVRRARAGGRPVLTLDGLRCAFTGPVDLTLAAGEIVAVFGLLGSGRTDLLETIAGVGRRLDGEILLGEEAVALASPGEALGRGIALVPANRAVQALFADLSVSDNMLMPHFSQLAKGGLRRRGAERGVFAEVARAVRLRPPSPAGAVSRLSGGNAQKVVVGRWLAKADDLRVLVMDEPTQGIDVGARRDLYRLLREIVDVGERTALVASSDPEEVVELADRALVLVGGRPAGVLSAPIAEDDLLTLANSDPAHAGTHR